MRRFFLPFAIGAITLGAGGLGIYLARPGAGAMENKTVAARTAPQDQGTKPGPVVAQVEGSTVSPESKAPAPRQRQVLDVEGMRKLQRKYQGMSVERNYARLFRQFGLNPEETDCLRALLMDRDNKRMDVTLQQMTEKPSAEQLKAWVKAKADQTAAINRESEALIRRFLNHEDDFKVYQAWEESLPVRRDIGSLMLIFGTRGQKLTQEQSDDLEDLAVQVRRDAAEAKAAMEIASPTPKSFADAASRQRWEEQIRLQAELEDRRLVEQSVPFLTQEQIVTLQSALEGWRMGKQQIKSGARVVKK